jgi:hypothetical protein
MSNEVLPIDIERMLAQITTEDEKKRAADWFVKNMQGGDAVFSTVGYDCPGPLLLELLATELYLGKRVDVAELVRAHLATQDLAVLRTAYESIVEEKV